VSWIILLCRLANILSLVTRIIMSLIMFWFMYYTMSFSLPGLFQWLIPWDQGKCPFWFSVKLLLGCLCTFVIGSTIIVIMCRSRCHFQSIFNLMGFFMFDSTLVGSLYSLLNIKRKWNAGYVNRARRCLRFRPQELYVHTNSLLCFCKYKIMNETKYICMIFLTAGLPHT
jgi:hypothetical protein